MEEAGENISLRALYEMKLASKSALRDEARGGAGCRLAS
jgi:hypothetical protein